MVSDGSEQDPITLDGADEALMVIRERHRRPVPYVQTQVAVAGLDEANAWIAQASQDVQHLLLIINRQEKTLRAAAGLLPEPPDPVFAADGTFHGLAGGPEHRTVGPHRAWCYDVSTWCYPQDPCPACLPPVDVVDLRAALGYAGLEAEDG